VACSRRKEILVSVLYSLALVRSLALCAMIPQFCTTRGYGFRARALVRAGMTILQLQIPVLADDRAAPAAVALAARQLEAGFLVDMTRGGEHAVRP
jgi:hypothetical protein